MTYSEKIDVLDLIIQVLREHENTLDRLVTRLEAAVDSLGTRDPYEYVRRRFHQPI